MTELEITTWSLELLDPRELKPAAAPTEDLKLQRAEIPCPEFSRFLYTAVGGPWYWLDRLQWSCADWERYLGRTTVETWVAYLQGTPTGYFELEQQDDGATIEIAQFGLLPRFIGRGLGGHLLTLAARRAWAMEPRRVRVHTFSLDGPHALANYKARGFHVFDTFTGLASVLDQPPGPWPGHADETA
jgi:GNAT superfamily N-acetyltransferase